MGPLALLDLVVQTLIVLIGLALVFSPETLTNGLGLAPGQDWLDDLLFAIPLGFLAYTGLETVANLAEEAREPGRTLPRSLFSAIGLVVALTVLVAVVGVTAFPAPDGTSALGDQWLEAPLVGIVTAFEGHLPEPLVEALRIAVGLSAALILLMAMTTSISGSARLAHSMGTHGMLPRALGRFERQTLLSRPAIAAITVVALGLVGVTVALVDCPDHTATGGYGGVLESVLSGEPGHDPVGWPTFKDWPAPHSLTHEGTYYRWLERAWRGGQRPRLLDDLGDELTRRREDQRGGAPRGRVERVDDRRGERDRLAGAGRALGQDVDAVQDVLDDERLDGER